jgi:dTDP-4-amino-4,6-dideoxygalactose transaminase
MEVPFVDLKAQYLSIKKEVDSALQGILDSTSFIGGKPCATFESDFSRLMGAKYCVGVGNGTDAIYLALRALGIGQGDSVITVANSFIASSEAITMAGARPIFIDCDPVSYTIDNNKLREYLNGLPSGHRVRAVIPVHLYGCPADMLEIMNIAREYGLKVVEDCAQAHLATVDGKNVGTFGDFGCFSFYPGKNLGAYGDAGAVLSNNQELATKLRMIANHGRIAKYDHELEGVNSRLDGLQAAILSVKLPRLQEWTERRINNARVYSEVLAGTNGLVLPVVPDRMRHVFHLYVVRVPHRDRIMERLAKSGISTGVHYPIALPQLRAYKYLEVDLNEVAIATKYQGEILSLPMFPELTVEQIHYVASELQNALCGK